MVGEDASDVFGTGTITDFFQQVGTLAWAIDLLNSLVTEEVMLLAVNFSILAEIPSEPVDLDTSRDARRSKTSSSEQRRCLGERNPSLLEVLLEYATC